jgi:hypothetical protein
MKRTIFKHKINALILAVLISAAGFYGCGNTSTTAPQANNLSLSAMSLPDSVGDSQNFFVVDTVKILIKDIKVDLNNTSEDSSDFKIGPFVLFLNLSSSINTISSAIIPAGTYEKIKFEVHKLEDAEAVPDPEFADANGSRYSVIVKGWYFGNYFVYRSTKSAHQILHFPNTIPLTSAVLWNVTMVVKPYIWFIKNGAYLDPRDSTNRNDIDNNIKDNINNHSFKAFKDNDKNGLPDPD